MRQLRNNNRTKYKNKKREAIWLLFLGIILFFMGMIFFTADKQYRKIRKEQYEMKITEVEKIMQREKDWIKENQSLEGGIYLNQSNGAKDVNPYFACQAAMGLLTGNITEEDMDAVKNYLAWHTKELNIHEGIMTNYRDSGKGLKATREYDSVDSYIALYLTLLSEYAACEGNLEEIAGWEEAVAYCAYQLDNLMEYGLTGNKHDDKKFYLMDNGEVWEACHRMGQMPLKKELADHFGQMEAGIYQAIKERLWNEQENRFEIGLDKDGDILSWDTWKDFYPDGIVQVFLKACDLSYDEDTEGDLYEQMCRHFPWETLDLEEDFCWAVTAYIGIKMEDETRAETFVNTYSSIFEKNRAYPLHTAEAGWTARTCEALIEYYEKEMEKGLLDLIFRT